MDRTAVGQIMLSRPLVALPILGALWGEPFMGLKLGMLLELFWINFLPVGSFMPPDDSFAGIVAMGIAVISRGTFQGAPTYDEKWIIALVVLFSIPIAVFGRWSDIFLRRFNSLLCHMADRAIEKTLFKSVERRHLMGIVFFYFNAAAGIFVLLCFGVALFFIISPYIGAREQWVLTRLYYLFPLIGIAVAYYSFSFKKKWKYLLAGIIFMSFAIEFFGLRMH